MKRAITLIITAALIAVLIIHEQAGRGAKAGYMDDSEIGHLEAVHMLTALGVINGYSDGLFRPYETVSRAEVAKMLCIFLNGGKEPELPVSTEVTVFTDIGNHWAEKYINYIASIGVVSGYGGGQFGPSDTVTGQQLAKMLLVSLNYDPETEQLEGTDWAKNTDALAEKAGMYAGLSADFESSRALDRESAAKMISNALYIDRVVYDYDPKNGVSAEVKKGTNIMENTFHADVITGVVVANKYGSLTESSRQMLREYDALKTTIIDPRLCGGSGSNTAFLYATEQEQLGTAVLVIVNRETGDTYGIIDAGKSREITISKKATRSEVREEISKAGLILAENVQLYINFEAVNSEYSANKAGTVTRFADCDGDGRIDFILTKEAIVAWYEGDGVIGVSNAELPEYSRAEYSGDSYKAGEPILCTVMGGVNYIEKCEMLTGVLTTISADLESVNIGGAIYENSELQGAVSIGECRIITSDIVVAYLDTCGYIVFSSIYE